MNKTREAVMAIEGQLKAALVKEFGDKVLDLRYFMVDGERVGLFTDLSNVSSWHDGGTVSVKVEGGERVATPARIEISRDGTPGEVTPRNVANTVRAIRKAVAHQRDIRQAHEAQKARWEEVDALRRDIQDALGVGPVRAELSGSGAVTLRVDVGVTDPESVAALADKIRAVLEENK